MDDALTFIFKCFTDLWTVMVANLVFSSFLAVSILGLIVSLYLRARSKNG